MYFNNYLGFNGIEVVDVERFDEFGSQSKDIFHCKVDYDFKVCGVEGCNGKLRKHGKKTVKLKDLPEGRTHRELSIAMNRYQCKTCGRTFTPILNIAVDRLRMTRRLLEAIVRTCLGDSITNTAKKYGVSYHVVQKIFDEVVRMVDESYIHRAPNVLGIDECHPKGVAHPVLTELHETKSKSMSNRVIGISKSRSKGAVISAIKSLANLENIAYATMDMYRPYYRAVKAVNPSIKVVIDKRHVLEYAREAMNEERLKIWRPLTIKERKKLRGKLKRLKRLINMRRYNVSDADKAWMAKELKKHNNLKLAYELKEDFYDMWEGAKNSTTARAYYKKWEASIPQSIRPSFKKTISIFKNWGDEIFAFFDAPWNITNSYTETANRMIKEINAMGMGRYAFHRLRARLLHRHGYWSEDMVWATVGIDVISGTFLSPDAGE